LITMTLEGRGSQEIEIQSPYTPPPGRRPGLTYI
jgi:hypothetical protein